MENIVKEIENIETEYKFFTPSISNEEQHALKDLMNNTDIILKPAEKWVGLVLMEQLPIG